MLRVGSAYNDQLQQLVTAVRNSIKETLLPIIDQEELNYTADAWPDRISQAIDFLLARWSTPVIRGLANRLSGNFVRSTLSFAERTQRRSLGIDIFQNSEQLTNYLTAATEQNVRLIQSIPQRYIENVSNTVLTGMRTGVRPEVIAKQLEEDYGVTQRRAKFIARDQAAKINGEIQKQRQIDAGYSFFLWVDAHDQRVRHRHREIANTDVGYGKGVYRWDDLPTSSSGETIQPGSDYNCFPGDSPINIFSGVKKVFRHPFRGKLSGFISEDGSRFESTPNHPVLTDRGFVAAQDVNIGDKIIKVPQQAFNIHEGHGKSLNIEFGKFFETCQLLGVSDKPVSAFSGNFHGDISEGQQINVVAFDWVLPDGFDADSAKRLVEFFFTFSDQMVVPDNTTGVGYFNSVIKGLTFAPDSIVRSLSKLLSLCRGSFTHSDVHPLASVGLLYSVFVENSSDDDTRGIEFFSDCFNAKVSIEQRLNLFNRYILLIGRYSFGFGDHETPSADCFADVVGTSSEFSAGGLKSIPLAYESVTVVDKFVREFDGHVYNLEMEQGLFVAQDTAVSNCRCIARPMRNSVVERNIKAKSN